MNGFPYPALIVSLASLGEKAETLSIMMFELWRHHARDPEINFHDARICAGGFPLPMSPTHRFPHASRLSSSG